MYLNHGAIQQIKNLVPRQGLMSVAHCAPAVSHRVARCPRRPGDSLPPEIVQASIASITVQGNWKSVYLPVPANRRMSSVYRGTLPFGQHLPENCFDALLLRAATDTGAELIGSRVFRAVHDSNGRVELSYQLHHMETVLKADFVIFAGGVNDKADRAHTLPTTMELFQKLQPDYIPPHLRKALIFELESQVASGMAEAASCIMWKVARESCVSTCARFYQSGAISPFPLSARALMSQALIGRISM